MLSRQLPTRPLPVAPVPIGYCGRNRRFVLRLYVHIEQSLLSHHYFARDALPLRTIRRFGGYPPVSTNISCRKALKGVDEFNAPSTDFNAAIQRLSALFNGCKT